MSDLQRLVYVSRTNGSQDPKALSREIDQILAVSRRNNSRCGVTGALIFNTNFFGQILEGAGPDVDRTFERIQSDARHRDVALLSYGPVDQRLFPDWSMGFVGKDQGEGAAFGAAARALSTDLSKIASDAVIRQLHTLALRTRPRPS